MSGFFNPTIAWITMRSTLGRKRVFLFAVPALILILFTVALKVSGPPSRPWPSHVLGTFGFSVLLPLTALIIGTSVLGATLIGRPAVTGVELTAKGLQVRASDYGAFCREVAVLSREHGIRLLELLPADESLESVFSYLLAS